MVETRLHVIASQPCEVWVKLHCLNPSILGEKVLGIIHLDVADVSFPVTKVPSDFVTHLPEMTTSNEEGKDANGNSETSLNVNSCAEFAIAYGTRVLWQRSLHSSPTPVCNGSDMVKGDRYHDGPDKEGL